MDAATVAVLAGVALVLAAIGTLALRRPRLALDASLRGGRDGRLYVTIHNRGPRPARGLRVRVGGRAGGATAWTAARELGVLEGHDVVRVEISALERGLAAAPDALVVEARARNALPKRREVALPPRGAAHDAAAPVRYDRAAGERCPARPDGVHALERHTFFNDGVDERWDVCPACRYVRRLPLTPAEEETQRRVREERSRREQAKLEEEWARRAQEAEAEAGARRRRERAHADAPGEGGLPLSVAFWILGLAPSRATWEDALAAHRALALRYHPDRVPGADPRLREAYEEKMREINAARDALRAHFRDGAPQRA